MIKIKRRFKRFRVDDPVDVNEYEEILNDSLCSITNREVQIEKNKTFNDEGKLESMSEITTYLVHLRNRFYEFFLYKRV